MEIKGTFKLEADYKAKTWTLTLKTEREPKPIGGHRYLALLEMSSYSHPISFGLDALGFWKIPDNPFMKVGRYYEKQILDKVCESGYKTFPFEEYKGNCFKVEGFSGLIDAYDEKANVIWECKTFSFRPKFNAYHVQLGFYLELFKRSFPDKPVPLAKLVTAKVDASADAELIEQGKEPQISENVIRTYTLPEEIATETPAMIEFAKQEYRLRMTRNDAGEYVFTSSMSQRGVNDDIARLQKEFAEWGLERVAS